MGKREKISNFYFCNRQNKNYQNFSLQERIGILINKISEKENINKVKIRTEIYRKIRDFVDNEITIKIINNQDWR